MLFGSRIATRGCENNRLKLWKTRKGCFPLRWNAPERWKSEVIKNKILGASVARNWAWRNRAVGGCQNTAVHHLEVCFCKISVRSNYMCGQRWGLLQQIFISESGKRPVATG